MLLALRLNPSRWVRPFLRPLFSQFFQCKPKDSCHLSATKNDSRTSIRSLRCVNQNFQQTRSFVTSSAQWIRFFCEELEHRRLVKLTGPDVVAFLQGLVTNDVRQLENEPSLYCMVLNAQGRVLYDVLLYKVEGDEPGVLLECNSDVSAELMSTMQKYKLRKKLKLSDVGDKLRVVSIFNKDSDLLSSDLPPLKFNDETKVYFHGLDPRIKTFAYRVVAPSSVNVVDVVNDCEKVKGAYDVVRYKIGLSEGTVDLPPGHCLPLESNLVFLNGVTFDKGCYVGQELTARTHHTGVIRKRLMPLILSSDTVGIKTDATVENSSGKACGKVRNVVGRHGLALLRLEEVVGKPDLIIKDGDNLIAEAKTVIPDWWNVESDAILTKITAKKQSS